MESKLHAWLYGLLYPAFLGSVFVVAFTSGLPSLAVREGQWFWALALYFLIQFGEGVENRTTYTIPDFVADVLELIFMGLGFHYLGALVADTPGTWGTSALGAVVVALLIPPVKRAVRSRWPGSSRTRRPLSVLSVLSFLAIGVVALSLTVSWISWIFIVLLAIYLLLVIRPDWRCTIDQKWFGEPAAAQDQARSNPSENSRNTPSGSDGLGTRTAATTVDDPSREATQG